MVEDSFNPDCALNYNDNVLIAAVASTLYSFFEKMAFKIHVAGNNGAKNATRTIFSLPETMTTIKAIK
jgi:hypothetical protein